WDSVRGHGERVERFRRAIRRNRLSHAYVFAGPEGIGKRLFARTLAQCLFCQRHADEELLACGTCSACKQVLAGTHPDLHEVGRKSGKSELTIDLFLGPPENRGREGLCYDLSRLPMAADRKIAIIDDASAMNDESANAFLKTLEEPPPKALIVLIAENLDALLPTIRSRSQTVRFDPLSPTDLADLMLQLEWVKDRPEAAALAELSDGSLAVAAQLLDPALRELRDALHHALANPEFDSVSLTERLTTGLQAIGGDSANQRRNAVWLVRFGLEFFRSAALYLSEQPSGGVIPAALSFARRFDARSPEDLEFVASLFDRVAETEQHIEMNIAVPRCLEVLCDDLGRKLRPAARR
ncbi:MAG TPA: DNA polymerase III subunit, partial [Planctomycetaceae bacterium]|nr:DNA polymerase III subunit [Planctomycetaceae bacterium]